MASVQCLCSIQCNVNDRMDNDVLLTSVHCYIIDVQCESKKVAPLKLFLRYFLSW